MTRKEAKALADLARRLHNPTGPEVPFMALQDMEAAARFIDSALAPKPPAFFAVAAGHGGIYRFPTEAERAAWIALGSSREAFAPSPEALAAMSGNGPAFWRPLEGGRA
jgi:hypothetical protein